MTLDFCKFKRTVIVRANKEPQYQGRWIRPLHKKNMQGYILAWALSNPSDSLVKRVKAALV